MQSMESQYQILRAYAAEEQDWLSLQGNINIVCNESANPEDRKKAIAAVVDSLKM